MGCRERASANGISVAEPDVQSGSASTYSSPWLSLAEGLFLRQLVAATAPEIRQPRRLAEPGIGRRFHDLPAVTHEIRDDGLRRAPADILGVELPARGFEFAILSATARLASRSRAEISRPVGVGHR